MDLRADQLLGMGRWTEARAAYQDQLAADPDNLEVRLGLGISLGSTGDLTGSIRELTSVLERVPDQIDARYNRALAYSAQGQNEQAISDLGILIEAHPDIWYFRSDRGGILLQEGQVEGALVDLRLAVELAPDEPVAWLNLGSALLAAGEFAEANAYLARAAKDQVPGARRALKHLRDELFLQTDRAVVREAFSRVPSS